MQTVQTMLSRKMIVQKNWQQKLSGKEMRKACCVMVYICQTKYKIVQDFAL